MTQEIDRSVVSIGLDFRPIPINIGDGVVWQFDPDPAPDVFDALVSGLAHIGQVGTQMSKGETTSLAPALQELQKVIGQMLVDPKQQKDWATTSYGLHALNALAQRLLQETTGFTDQSSKPSGGGSASPGRT